MKGFKSTLLLVFLLLCAILVYADQLIFDQWVVPGTTIEVADHSFEVGLVQKTVGSKVVLKQGLFKKTSITEANCGTVDNLRICFETFRTNEEGIPAVHLFVTALTTPGGSEEGSEDAPNDVTPPPTNERSSAGNIITGLVILALIIIIIVLLRRKRQPRVKAGNIDIKLHRGREHDEF